MKKIRKELFQSQSTVLCIFLQKVTCGMLKNVRKNRNVILWTTIKHMVLMW